MTVAAWSVASFLVGVAVGAALSATFTIARTGHDGSMSSPPPRSRFRLRSLRPIGIALVAVALASNAAVGFLQIQNGRSDEARSRCSVRYNELDGKARDERNAQAVTSTESELELWRTIRDDVREGRLTGESLVDAISRHIDELTATQRTRVANPYPPADLCRISP